MSSGTQEAIYIVNKADPSWKDVIRGLVLLQIGETQKIMCFRSKYNPDTRVMTFFVENSDSEVFIVPGGHMIRVTIIINDCLQELYSSYKSNFIHPIPSNEYAMSR